MNHGNWLVEPRAVTFGPTDRQPVNCANRLATRGRETMEWAFESRDLTPLDWLECGGDEGLVQTERTPESVAQNLVQTQRPTRVEC